MVYLNAAAQLLDASLVADPMNNPPRLGQLHYPAALDWMRIDDVIRIARGAGAPISKRALGSRWASKDDFVRDAIVHALLYRDDPSADPAARDTGLHRVTSSMSFAESVAGVVDGLVDSLLVHPRAFLLAHIAPLLPRHPEIAEQVRASSCAAQTAWTAEYVETLQALGIGLRPDWPFERLTLAIQLVLDGTIVRSRVEPDNFAASRWASGSMYADTVLALIASVLDIEGDQRDLRTWLDERAQRRMA